MLTLRKVLGNRVHVVYTRSYVSCLSCLNSSHQIVIFYPLWDCLPHRYKNSFRKIKYGGEKERGRERERTYTQPSTLAESTFIIFYTYIPLVTMKYYEAASQCLVCYIKHYSIELSVRMEKFSQLHHCPQYDSQKPYVSVENLKCDLRN